MLALGFLQGLLTYPQVSTSFELSYHKSDFNEAVLAKCPSITDRTYRPSP